MLEMLNNSAVEWREKVDQNRPSLLVIAFFWKMAIIVYGE